MRFVVWIQEAGLPVFNQLRHAADVRRDDRAADQLGFAHRVGRIVDQGRMDEERCLPEFRNDLRGVDFSDEADVDLFVPQSGARLGGRKVSRLPGNAPLKVQPEQILQQPGGAQDDLVALSLIREGNGQQPQLCPGAELPGACGLIDRGSNGLRRVEVHRMRGGV